VPTYDYKCEVCNFEFETFKKISELKDDGTDQQCSKCSSHCRRIVSGGTGVIFKGPGFFINDYAKPGTSRKEMEAKEKAKSEI